MTPGAGLRGRLLVASPELAEDSFRRTVVLLLEHGDEGAVGVVLNRPTEMAVGEPLPAWADVAADPGVVFIGGPVQRSSAICLAHGRSPVEVEGWTPYFGDVGTVDLNLTPAAIPGIQAIRVFAGHAGWGPGQLESELERGGWVVCDLEPGDALTARPEDLWERVLLRQPGLLPLLARAPLQPFLN